MAVAKITFTIRLVQELHDKLQEKSTQTHRSMNELISEAVESMLDGKQPPPPKVESMQSTTVDTFTYNPRFWGRVDEPTARLFFEKAKLEAGTQNGKAPDFHLLEEIAITARAQACENLGLDHH